MLQARMRNYFVYLGLLMLAFASPLAGLAAHAAARDLHSHILLVPFIVGYLLYTRQGALPAPGARSLGAALTFTVPALAALAAGIAWRDSLSHNDYLALMTASFVLLAAAGGFYAFGSKWMAAAAFPFGFLVFMIPLPDTAVSWLETWSQLASAEAAAMYFALAGTPLVRTGTVFELPGITLRVAEECSGIRSSWVLFITSLLAANLFLDGPWRRVVLVLFVIPLGILRNGFRVFVIGLLCVHIGPHMIDSVIHRRGGPIFFALSLLPLFALLWWLRRRELRRPPPN